MPNYQYKCSHKRCKRQTEIFHTISECDNPSKETLEIITCPKHGVMKRVIFAPLLNGASGKSEKQLLNDKAAYVRKRAKAHTANEAYKEIKDPDIRRNIEKKRKAGFYDDVKGKDPDKMKV